MRRPDESLAMLVPIALSERLRFRCALMDAVFVLITSAIFIPPWMVGRFMRPLGVLALGSRRNRLAGPKTRSRLLPTDNVDCGAKILRPRMRKSRCDAGQMSPAHATTVPNSADLS